MVTSAGTVGPVTASAPHGFTAGPPRLKDILGTYSLVARGAGYPHRFGLAIDHFAAPRAGSIQIETYAGDGTLTLGQSRQLVTDTTQPTSNYIARSDGTYSLELDGLIPDDALAMPTAYANTSSATASVSPVSVRFLVTFSVDAYENGILDNIGQPPWDPYLEIDRFFTGDFDIDIHLPGSWPLPGRPSWLPTETQNGNQWSESFYEGNGWPYALVIPSGSFRWPLEGANIETGSKGLAAPYPTFHTWRTSYGAKDGTWYNSPTLASPPCVTSGYPGDLAGRTWTLNL
jgi:LruC domain-containing protein